MKGGVKSVEAEDKGLVADDGSCPADDFGPENIWICIFKWS